MITILAIVIAVLLAWLLWLDRYTAKLADRISELERQVLDRRAV